MRKTVQEMYCNITSQYSRRVGTRVLSPLPESLLALNITVVQLCNIKLRFKFQVQSGTSQYYDIKYVCVRILVTITSIHIITGFIRQCKKVLDDILIA